MNYLGHAYLSFGNQDILTGNMISDFIKGNKKALYPTHILNGILLHREIDRFTDTREEVKEIAAFFRPVYRLYALPISDIILDYFLANDEKDFPTDDHLQLFTKDIYRKLGSNSAFFPDKFRNIFPYMQSQNWLYNYRFDHGILKSLQGLQYRAVYLGDIHAAFNIFLKNKTAIRLLYQSFKPAVKKHAGLMFEELINS